MTTNTYLIFMLAFSVISSVVPVAHAAPKALQQQAPIEVSSTPKRFDLLTVDGARHRLLAAHSEAGTLSIIDLAAHKVESEVPVGESSGVAVDARDDKYFVGTTKGVAVVDRNTLKKTGFIVTPGPADAMAFDSTNDRLYVGHDDGKELWVINARRDRLIKHIQIPGTPELMDIDPSLHSLYLNIKDRNEGVAIDLHTDKIVAHWSTLPTQSPHGLALDLQDRRIFIAGHSSSIAVRALPDGKQLPSIDIGQGRVDQIAFDAKSKRLYCPSSGQLVSIQIGPDTNSVIGSNAIPHSTHSVAIDPETHWVWIAYADQHGSYVQGFSPTTASSGQKRH